ncbi:hypothetical protein [Gilvimarinus agarilyticus]|uniref:hypothetical protein n=1 Tax=Gilvimarinus agarilyticus TaxID=679259 RepID=UPI000696DD2C|nr:hypothetical protein [Gilvimarinus agarilyticus]
MSYELLHAVKKCSLLPCLVASLVLVGCGSDDDDNDTTSSSSVASSASSSSSSSSTPAGNGEWPDLNIEGAGAGTLHISWDAVEGTSFYRLYKDPDGTSGFSQVGDDLTAPEAYDQISTHLTNWPEARYMVEACASANDCSNSNEATAINAMLDTIGYLKASNAEANDWFGWSLDLSADGTTLAVGGLQEDSMAQGVDGDQSDNSTLAAGAVYVFIHNNGEWQQQAYLKASNTEAPFEDDDGNELVRSNDRFGYSVSLSDNGNTLAVGALLEDSNATGINGDETDNSAANAGAVYLFERSDGSWSQTAYVKASNTPEEEDSSSSSSSSSSSEDTSSSSSVSSVGSTTAGDRFGHSVALSGDGKTLAVGAIGEDSSSGGINGDESLNDISAPGAVYVFANDGTNWAQQAYVKAETPRADDQFGFSVALDYSGDTLAVGANGEDVPGNGVNQEIPTDAAAKPDSGAVFVFNRSAGEWAQTAYIKPGYSIRLSYYNSSGYLSYISGLRFGASVDLSSDGKRLAVGAPGEGSRATGVNGDPSDYTELDPDYSSDMESFFSSGAAYIFEDLTDGWEQTSYIKASNTGPGDTFGTTVRLSGDGSYLVVGAYFEDSAAVGINGDETDNSAENSGALYMLGRGAGGVWSQLSYVKAAVSDSQDRLGRAFALSSDGARLATSAYREAGQGPDAEPTDNSADATGAVSIY